MKLRLCVIVVAFSEFCVVGWMAAQREWILRNGSVLVLRTAPVDPSDPMRGAYTHLNYSLNSVPKALCRDGALDIAKSDQYYDSGVARRARDHVVYASLETLPNGEVALKQLSDRQPKEGTFLRGRIDYVSGSQIQVRYGIEAYFADRASAARVDRERIGAKRGAPLDVELAVSHDGIAVIRRIFWEPLGLTVRVRRAASPRGPAATGDANPAPLLALEVELKNYSAQPIGIVVRPQGHSFRIVSAAQFGDAKYEWIHRNDPVPEPQRDEIRVLRPGEAYHESLDANDPYWGMQLLATDKTPREISSLSQLGQRFGDSFRVEYAPGITTSASFNGVETPARPVQSPRWFPTQGAD